MSVYLAFFWAFVFAVLLGCFLEFAILRRAKEPNILGMIVITIGIEMVLLGFVSWKFGAEQKTMPFPLGPYEGFMIGDIFISKLEVLTLVAALLLMSVLFYFLNIQNWGLP